MPLEIRFEAPNMDKVEATFTQLGNIDFTDLWPLFRRDLFAIEAEMFATQGAHGMHGEWAPNEPEYQKRKERKWSISEIERASGRLFYSLTGETTDSVFESTRDAMTFGTAVPYALWQQTGFRTRLGEQRAGHVAPPSRRPLPARCRRYIGKAHVSPRRLFDLTDSDVRRLEATAHRWYMNKARRLGFAIFGRGEGAGAALGAGRIALGEQFPVSKGI